MNNIIEYLDELFPNPRCELNYNKDYELLIAVMLSAQTTDKRVNMVTDILFKKYDSLEKLAFSLNEVEEKEDTNLFSTFETEFGRTLSPMEYEIINSWKDNGYTDELITLALKEATYNGVSSLRYIDKIIYEWGKKGIKTKEDVEKNKKQFKNNNSTKKELFDYDWLNNE